MKILIRQFLGKNHSWSIVGWEFARAAIKKGHEVHLFSTDGIEHLPQDLKSHLIGYREENNQIIHGRAPDPQYDCQFSYTCLKNFAHQLGNGTRNRLGMWCFEWQGKNILPSGFAKQHQYCDFLIAPSIFEKQIFIDSGIPSNKIVVIPHGVGSNFNDSSTISPLTAKRFKILSNIAQNHKRKNIPGLLTAYGKAFTDRDDVCLLIKGKEKPITQQFEVSLNQCLKDFYQAFPKHAEVKVIPEFLDDLAPLYRSVDAVFTMSHCEGFYIPGLEALASGKINICPRFGGQLDFLDDNNALLINGKIGRADPTSMYWESKPNAQWFIPSVDSAVAALRSAYDTFEQRNVKLEAGRPDIYARFGWDRIADQILSLCK
jgi:glycosyltransferase involved in cell wall biosynthesis